MHNRKAMKRNHGLKIWARQVRAPFLLLSPILVLIPSTAVYHHTGHFHFFHYSLLSMGIILAHISVNLFNELSDHQSGIDDRTRRTPFSGGSSMMQAGKTRPRAVHRTARITLFLAGIIGIYYCYFSGWVIAIFMLTGAVAIRFYTSHLSHRLLGETAAGLALGSLVVLGAYYALTSRLNPEILLVSIPPGILTFLLLLANEFPDVEADRFGGRNHLLIRFGPAAGTRIYLASMILVYLSILLIPLITPAPSALWIAIFPLPLGVKASFTLMKQYGNRDRLISALGINVSVVLFTDAFLGLGYLIAPAPA